MKKIILSLIATVFFGINSFSQKKEMSIFKNENEVCILLKNDKGIYDENFIFQSDNIRGFSQNNIVTENYKLFYDGKNLIINISNITYQFTINERINGENIIKGYGLSRRFGTFKITDIDDKTSFFDRIIETNSNPYSTLALTCDSGGPGATQCSVDSGIGSINVGCSVTCGSGYYACCDDSTSVCKCVAIKKNVPTQARFDLTINPTKTNLEFTGKEHEKYFIRVYTTNGNMVINNIILQKMISIDNLKPDIYIYHIYDNDGYSQEGKIIKK